MSNEEEVVNNRVVKYSPGPTVKHFGNSTAFVRGIMGPIGSGKSVGCCIEILRRAKMQVKGPDGIRRTRWAVIRNSYPELKSTTMKTWSEWAPGKITGVPPYTYLLETQELHVEVLFLALDHPDDARKVLSLEVTGVWINEAREVPKTIIDGLTGRVGRYPSKNMGGCTWSGIIMDTNAPDNESWWFNLAENEHPEGWEFFKQPSGRSPEAENLENLPPDYYTRIMAGKEPEWIKIYVDGEYGFLIEGLPVFPQFRDRIHVSESDIEPVRGLPLYLGADFGLTPACAVGQKLPDGRWQIIDEFVTEDCGVTRFSESLSIYMMENYPEFQVAGCWGDPSGANRAQNDEKTALEIMTANTSWKWKPAPGDNTLTMRFEVVRGALNRLIDGKPGILISPKAKVLRKSMAGGYQFKLLRSGDGTQTHSEPDKNKFSHVAEGLQYLLLGGGESSVVLNKERKRSGRQKVALGMDASLFRK